MARQIEVKVVLNDTDARQKIVSFDKKLSNITSKSRTVKLSVSKTFDTKLSKIVSQLSSITNKKYDLKFDLGNATKTINAFNKSITQLSKSISLLGGSPASAAKVVKDLGVSLGPIGTGVANNTNAVRTFVHTLTGMSDATVKAIGNVRMGGDVFQQYAATTQNAAGGLNTFRFSINEATGEIFQLDTGVNDSIGAMDRATKAADRLGQVFTGTIPTGLTASRASIEEFVHSQAGMETAVVQTTGAVTNAAGRWQQFTAAVTNANGDTQTLKYSFNEATGELRVLDQGIKNGSQSFINAAQAAERLGKNIGNVSAASARDINAITAYVQGLTGMNAATLDVERGVNNAAGLWQQYSASIQQADGTTQMYTVSVNTATGEVRLLDNGLQRINNDAAKSAAALQKMGTSVGKVTPATYATNASMQQYVNTLTGLENATVKAKGSVTNAAGTFQLFDASVRQGDGSLKVFRLSVNTLTGEVYQLDKGVKSTSTGFSSLAGKAASFIKTMLGFYGVASLVRQTFTELKKVDAELTNYIKVTGASEQRSQTILKQAYDAAIQYGVTAEAMMSGVAAFARAGYQDNAMALAGLSAELQLVGSMAAEDADSFLIAADAAYKLGGNITELNTLVNYATVIDNKYATTIDKVAEGFTRIASVAAVSGTPVKELMAALGTISASQQWEGNVTGTALRAIFLAINKDTISEIEEGVTVSEEAIKTMDDALQVFAKDEWEAAQAAGKILDPMKALAALAKSYNEGFLTDTKLYEIANTLGGKRYTNALVGLIQNWDMYESMLSDMGTYTDAADKAMSVALESWDAKLNKLKTTWQSMFSESGSTGIIKWALDAAQGFLVFADSIENLIGMVGGLAIAIKTAVAAIKGIINGAEAAVIKTNWIIAAIAAAVAIAAALKSAIDSAETARNNSYASGSSMAYSDIQKMMDDIKKNTADGIDLLKQYKEIAEDGIDTEEIETVRDLQEQIKEILGDQVALVDLLNGGYEQNAELVRDALIAANNEKINRASLETANMLLDINKNSNYTSPQTFTRSSFEYFSGWNNGIGFASDKEYEWFKDNVIGNTGSIQAQTFSNDFGITHKFGFLLPEYQTIDQAVEDFKALEDIVTQMSTTMDENGILLSTKYAATFGEISKYVEGIRDPMERIISAQGMINDAAAENVVLESDIWKTTYNTEQERQDAIEALIQSNSALTDEQKNAVRTFAKQVTDVRKTLEEVPDGSQTQTIEDDYTRLTNAINAATSAKERFDKAIKTTKADGANAYIEAFKALQEELSAGKYNSTRAHAAYRMLLGDQMYESANGEVSVLRQLYGGSEEAWKILTDDYQDQNGNKLEGFGLYALAQKYGNIGLSRDANGNISWDFSDGNLDQLSALSGISSDILRLFANAMDQYDKNGKDNTEQEEGTSEDPNTVAVNSNTEAIHAATAAIQNLDFGNNGSDGGNENGGAERTAKVVEPEVDKSSLSAAEKKMDGLTATETKTIIIKTEGGGGLQTAATGKSYSYGGPTLVNDGSGKELIVDNGTAYIANGGDPAIVNLSKGAKVYTAEQTRRILMESGIRSAKLGLNPIAVGMDDILSSSGGSYLGGTADGITEVSLVPDEEEEEEKKEEKKKSGGGSANANSQWEKIGKISPYILQRLNKALDKQTELIDKQIESIEKEQAQKEQQNQLEEYQRAVIQAQNDLLEAQSNRTVRYLDDNGQWHWMADANAVQEAEKNLDDSQKALQDYLEELTYQAQVQVLEDEKQRLADEYSEINDFWNDILEQYETPTGDLNDLLKTVMKNGTATQKNAANTIMGTLLPLMTGGSYTKNYSEALSAVAAATGKSGALMPSLTTDEALAALIASSGTGIGQDAMLSALQGLAGTGTAGTTAGNGNTENTSNKYYYINGVHIGNDIAELPLSEVLERLSLFTNN